MTQKSNDRFLRHGVIFEYLRYKEFFSFSVENQDKKG